MNKILNFNRWEVSIGKLILSCARVEYELMRLYEFWLPNRKYYKDSYEKRYGKAIGKIKEKYGESVYLVDRMIIMKKMAQYRHIVAHNPIHFSNENNEWKIFDLKTNSYNSVNLLELETLSNKAELISIKLSADLRMHIK